MLLTAPPDKHPGAQCLEVNVFCTGGGELAAPVGPHAPGMTGQAGSVAPPQAGPRDQQMRAQVKDAGRLSSLRGCPVVTLDARGWHRVPSPVSAPHTPQASWSLAFLVLMPLLALEVFKH